MTSKLQSLKTAVSMIPDGAVVGLGGVTLNRAPMAAVYELARAKKRGLHLVKTAGALDVDLLCLAGCASEVSSGFISCETAFGLCPNYRKSVQEGSVRANEHACYTVISALRAAAYGIPFMPVRGLVESDLIAANSYFRATTDPFSGEQIYTVQAIRPDWAIVHVQLADEFGNALIESPAYDDLLLTRAAESVLVTAEEIVKTDRFAQGELKANIPHFLTHAVVLVKGGAHPCSCYSRYGVDGDEIRSLLALRDLGALDEWLKSREGDQRVQGL